MDLVGPLPAAQGNCQFAAVVVDYFTKWVEAKPLANIRAPTIQKFFWQNIICRFGVPRELTVDNGKQFDYYTFKEYCKTLGTHAKFSSLYHPQSNGAVERENGLIFSGIKKCLFDQKKGKWVDELPKVIRSHNTTVSRATGFTPFRLLVDTEAMTPEEIKNESMRVMKAKEIEKVDKKVEKDMIELSVLEAAKNIEKYQKETKAWRDKKVVRKDIKTGDLVLKKKKNRENPGKLHESWEGPYIAKETDMHRGFSFDRANWRRVAIFVEYRQPEKVLPLKVPVVARCNLEYFSFFANLHSKKLKNLNHVSISDFGKKQ
jgi:hypothetical protein